MIEKIKDFIANNFQIDKEKLIPEAHLKDDLDLNSLDVVDIAMYIEEEFGIILSEEDLADLTTIESFINLLEKSENK